MKRWIAALLAALCVLGLVGCREIPEPEQDVSDTVQWAEMTYVTNMEEGEQLLTLQTPILEQKHIRLQKLELPAEDPAAALEQLISVGQIPDILLLEGLPAEKLRGWVDRGVLRCIPTGKLKAKTALWEHLGAWATAFSDKRGWWAVPVEAWNPQAGASPLMLYCRTDWAKTLGVEDLSHMTWADFITLLRGYAHGDPDFNGVADTWGLTYAGAAELQAIFYGSFGVEDWMWQEGELVPGFSGAEAKEATQWLTQLTREGILDPEGSTHTPEEALELFCRGYAGMLLWDDPVALENTWRDIQATREKAKPIIENVTVIAMPENPYGTVQFAGDRDSAPLIAFGAGVDDEKLEKVLYIMEEVSRLAWQVPETLPEDASFTQRCAYRQRMYYRPAQRSVPSLTLAMGDMNLASANRKARQQAQETLAELIGRNDSFESLWADWCARNEELLGGWRSAVNTWATEQGYRSE